MSQDTLFLQCGERCSEIVFIRAGILKLIPLIIFTSPGQGTVWRMTLVCQPDRFLVTQTIITVMIYYTGNIGKDFLCRWVVSL